MVTREIERACPANEGSWDEFRSLVEAELQNAFVAGKVASEASGKAREIVVHSGDVAERSLEGYEVAEHVVAGQGIVYWRMTLSGSAAAARAKAPPEIAPQRLRLLERLEAARARAWERSSGFMEDLRAMASDAVDGMVLSADTRWASKLLFEFLFDDEPWREDESWEAATAEPPPSPAQVVERLSRALGMSFVELSDPGHVDATIHHGVLPGKMIADACRSVGIGPDRLTVLIAGGRLVLRARLG